MVEKILTVLAWSVIGIVLVIALAMALWNAPPILVFAAIALIGVSVYIKQRKKVS
jgi:4-hydroxybenzoate polyprenyltransferase